MPIDLPVADHAATSLDGARFRRVEKLGDDDRRRVDAAHLADEIRIGSLARARGASEQDQLLGKAQSAAAELLLHLAPDGTEDELRILDLQIEWRWSWRVMGAVLGSWSKPIIAEQASRETRPVVFRTNLPENSCRLFVSRSWNHPGFHGLVQRQGSTRLDNNGCLYGACEETFLVRCMVQRVHLLG